MFEYDTATIYTNMILDFQESKKKETGSEFVFKDSGDFEKAARKNYHGSPELFKRVLYKAYDRIPLPACSLRMFVTEILKCMYFCDTFYVEISDNLFKELCKYHFLDINQLAVYINAALALGIFDKKMYEKYAVLTSCDIQNIFLLLNYDRDIEPDINYKYWLIEKPIDEGYMLKSLLSYVS